MHSNVAVERGSRLAEFVQGHEAQICGVTSSRYSPLPVVLKLKLERVSRSRNTVLSNDCSARDDQRCSRTMGWQPLRASGLRRRPELAYVPTHARLGSP